MVQGRCAGGARRRARVGQARAPPRSRPLLNDFRSLRLAAITRGDARTDDPVARAYVGAVRDAWCGAFDDAEAALAELLDDPVAGVAARISLGSVLRQTGRHAAAEVHDRAALDAATDPLDRSDALISLVADAVGTLDGATSAARLTEAERAVGGDDERGYIRLDWVRTEVALLHGRPADAAMAARRAMASARALGWPRHLAKSALFAGAACQAAGRGGDRALAAAAEAHLREAIEIASSIAARPIEEAARALLDGR